MRNIKLKWQKIADTGDRWDILELTLLNAGFGKYYFADFEKSDKSWNSENDS